jgi:hypothetical protein
MSLWDDPVKESVKLQERSEASESDRVKGIDPFTPPDDGPERVLVRRVTNGWLEAKRPDEAAALIASGEYRPFMATEGYTENGTVCCQADREWVEYGRRERIRALVVQRARADMDAMAASISFLTDEEIDALESSLIEPSREATGAVRSPAA